ncbi:hypothetical protein KFK09_004503 [Dendrobium nobile]|uniref:Secreted protein n=1 Tax=Dendrobium nobile TaxID=94219 RepID=A0A8T3C0I6_DENNO|nr:hypothetical protein KFK09_004503 [Dendrobium nobile]
MIALCTVSYFFLFSAFTLCILRFSQVVKPDEEGGRPVQGAMERGNQRSPSFKSLDWRHLQGTFSLFLCVSLFLFVRSLKISLELMFSGDCSFLFPCSCVRTSGQQIEELLTTRFLQLFDF